MAIFSFLGGKKTVPESKMSRRNQNPVDMTYGLQANEDLLEGLFAGTYHGLEGASAIARIPVLVPANMMGIPTPKSEDKRTQEALDKIISNMASEINIIKRKYLNVGTTWVYPKWISSKNKLVWKIIKDSTIPDIMGDLNSEEPETILVDEQITITAGENDRKIINRKTTYTEKNVTVKYSGSTGGLVKDVSMVNKAGILPAMFAHLSDDTSRRGHSVNEPLLYDYKCYHDIDYRIAQTIGQFSTKQVQTIKDIKNWRHNNNLDSASELEEYDVSLVDLIMNIDGEKTEYLHLPADATDAGQKDLERRFIKIVEGSGVDEIFWGGAVQGNNGSYSEQKQSMIVKIQDYRTECNKPFHQLLVGTLRLRSIVDNYQYDLNFTDGWNRLTSISEKDQSNILQQFCSAMAGAVTAGAIGIHQLYELWCENYPDIQYKDEAEFKADLVKTANLQQFLKQDAVTGEAMMTVAGDNLESIVDGVNK
jgi:hypothetical protein